MYWEMNISGNETNVKCIIQIFWLFIDEIFATNNRNYSLL